MYRCAACRAAFVHPMPDPHTLKRFYDDFHKSTSAGGCYDDFEDRMRDDFPAKVSLIAPPGNPTVGRLLDVGCGKGFFVKACADRGIDAQGVDLSETGVAYARDILKVTALHGSLHDLKADLGKFDVVTFWATIEHLSDPIGMLRDIADVMKPAARLFCDTGIGDDWLDRLLPGVAQWYDPPQHLFVFSRAGMVQAMRAAGLIVQRIDPTFDRTRARRLIRRLRGAVLAGGLRAAATIGRMTRPPVPFTRYPVGNLMMVEAIKPATNP
jgi:SAM-dependent methyltransferase